MKRKKPEWTCVAEHSFDGDIVITDPCYIRETSRSFSWDEREALMKEVGLFSRTYYGDWGCTVFKVREGSTVGQTCRDSAAIGEFCADAGLVCVLDLLDARKIAPDIDKWIVEHDRCATVIRGFKGKVRLMTMTTKRWIKDWKDKRKRIVYDDVELRVRGDGMKDGNTFCFESVQTSL